jgi:hypothetical protein
MPSNPRRSSPTRKRHPRTKHLTPATHHPTRRAWALVIVGMVLCAGLAVVGVLRSTTALSQAQFANPQFQGMWSRTDGLVASGTVKRPWVWGPVPGRSVAEPFAGLPGNSHLVQYFDKGRMEINDPNGDPDDPFYVTNGLLAVELISGQMQTGLSTFESRSPASINLASDADDPSAPTYLSFNGVANIPGAPNERRKQSQVGQVVRTAIDRQGVTQPWPQDHLDYGVKIAHFEEATGHNIPDIFWEYLNQQTQIVQEEQVVTGPLFFPWFAVTGYPISEPYWSYVKVSGKYTDVLIQAYERRVLTFVPHLPSPFKVQMGNIGQHYYEWRYLAQPGPPPQPGPSTPTASAPPPLPNITIDEIAYRQAITDLNGNYVVLTNKGDAPQSLSGWWLDSPKWSTVDRFYFPEGVAIGEGASIRVHAGAGVNTATDVYMYRTSVMWEGKAYDLALLYDNYGREVASFFPASDVGAEPTKPPEGTQAVPLVGTPPTATRTPAAEETKVVPSPVGTEDVLPTLPASTPTTTRVVTGTVTITSTITVTATITRTVTPTPTP